MNPAVFETIADAISLASGQTFSVSRHHSIAGGCINQNTVLAATDGRRFFVKLNQVSRLDMFKAEAAGLAELAQSKTVRVPIPLTFGIAGEHAFLAMEWLNLSPGIEPGKLAIKLGEQLAAMHATTWRAHGWTRANTIGSTDQANPPTENWVEFFQDARLRPQLKLAAQNGAAKHFIDRGNQLLESVGAFFTTYQPMPSLLHGDLWGGNVGICSGEPVIFDPAVYFGDRETDIAMSELFGGFPDAFYDAYQAIWPLDTGYASRKLLYQLYHLLNHFNLFGGSYARQSQMAIDQLLAELS